MASEAAMEAMRSLADEQSFMITPQDRDNYASWGNNGYRWEADVYKSEGFRVLYVEKLFSERIRTSQDVFKKINLTAEPGGAIVSIGCGFGAELVAVYNHIKRSSNSFDPDMVLIGIDSVPGWIDCIQAINEKFASSCDNQRDSELIQFQVGKLSADVDEQCNLVARLRKWRATTVILSHVVYDFARDFMCELLSRMSAVESLQRVIIMDRVVYNDYPVSNTGFSNPHVDEVELTNGRRTKIIEYVQTPWTSSSSSDSSSESGSSSSSDASSSDANREKQSDVDDLANLMDKVNVSARAGRRA